MLTTKQVCETYQISRQTLHRWIREGLPVHRGYRGNYFITEEIATFLQTPKAKGQPKP